MPATVGQMPNLFIFMHVINIIGYCMYVLKFQWEIAKLFNREFLKPGFLKLLLSATSVVCVFAPETINYIHMIMNLYNLAQAMNKLFSVYIVA